MGAHALDITLGLVFKNELPARTKSHLKPHTGIGGVCVCVEIRVRHFRPEPRARRRPL